MPTNGASLPLATELSQSSVVSRNYRVTTSTFGNGYTQRATDGINAISDDWSLVWDSISSTDLATLTSFFDGLYGVYYFTWQAPQDTTTKKWVTNGKYNINVMSGNVYTLTVPITQVMDL